MALLGLVVLADPWVYATARAQTTQVLVAPASSVVAVGAAVTVEVHVLDVLELYGVDLRLAFDPALLEVVDADGNPANGLQVEAGTFLSPVYRFTAANWADNSTGQIRYVVSLLSPAAPATGSGVLLRITFRGRELGSSSLQVQALLVNGSAEPIEAVVSNGEIVVSGNTATPTATVTATDTPMPTSTYSPTRTATPTVTSSHTPTPTASTMPTRTHTPTRTGTLPAAEHLLWLPLLVRGYPIPTPTPLSTRTSTPTATAVASPTASATRTVEATPTPSATGETTPAVTRTPTPTASAIASPTTSATRTVTVTPTPSVTGDTTPIVTRTPTPTPTASTVHTPTPSVTPTAEGTPSPTPGSRQLLLNSSFETDEAWTREGGCEPAYTMARAYSGIRSMRLGIILPYSERVFSSIWQEVDLPGHLTEARLSLYYFPIGWPEHTDEIYLYVTRASDGTTLFSHRWMQWAQTWHSYTVDLLSRLEPYAGQRVRLRIGVYNDGDGMTAVYVDDAELWVTY